MALNGAHVANDFIFLYFTHYNTSLPLPSYIIITDVTFIILFYTRVYVCACVCTYMLCTRIGCTLEQCTREINWTFSYYDDDTRNICNTRRVYRRKLSVYRLHNRTDCSKVLCTISLCGWGYLRICVSR